MLPPVTPALVKAASLKNGLHPQRLKNQIVKFHRSVTTQYAIQPMHPGLHESRSAMLSCVAVFSKLMYSYHKPYQLFLEWRLIMLFLLGLSSNAMISINQLWQDGLELTQPQRGVLAAS